MKFNILALSFALVKTYQVNHCRDFSGQLIEDFSMDDFTGEWFPVFRSKHSMRLMGKCPVWYFERYEAATELQAKKQKALSNVQENFRLHRSYKGNAGITDNVSKYMGYFDIGTSNGAIYSGVTLTPMNMFKDNFQILSTDYEKYAIVYTCTFKTTMYNRDDITILVRDLDELPDVMETVKKEFERLFQGEEQLDDEKPDTDVFKEVGDEKKEEGEDEGEKQGEPEAEAEKQGEPEAEGETPIVDEEFLKLDEGTAAMVRVRNPK